MRFKNSILKQLRWNTKESEKKYPEELGFGLRQNNSIAWAELPKPYTGLK